MVTELTGGEFEEVEAVYADGINTGDVTEGLGKSLQ